MEHVQAWIDNMNARWQRERQQTQFTLGKLITTLEGLVPDRPVTGFGKLMSYRGYYCDLAFEPSAEVEAVATLLNRCQFAMGKVFEGYKGGDFQMGETTPLWIAQYGSSGERLMALDVDNDPITPQTSPEQSE